MMRHELDELGSQIEGKTNAPINVLRCPWNIQELRRQFECILGTLRDTPSRLHLQILRLHLHTHVIIHFSIIDLRWVFVSDAQIVFQKSNLIYLPMFQNVWRVRIWYLGKLKAEYHFEFQLKQKAESYKFRLTQKPMQTFKIKSRLKIILKLKLKLKLPSK